MFTNTDHGPYFPVKTSYLRDNLYSCVIVYIGLRKLDGLIRKGI
jgi:hypothetical protein